MLAQLLTSTLRARFALRGFGLKATEAAKRGFGLLKKSKVPSTSTASKRTVTTSKKTILRPSSSKSLIAPRPSVSLTDISPKLCESLLVVPAKKKGLFQGLVDRVVPLQTQSKVVDKVRGFFSRDKILAKAKREMNKHADRIGMPLHLRPKIALADDLMEAGLAGGYMSRTHTILLDGTNKWFALFPWKMKGLVKHELKHADQFMQIARRGMNRNLPAELRLPENIAQVCRNGYSLPGNSARAMSRVDDAVESAIANGCLQNVNARTGQAVVKLGESLEKAFDAKLGAVVGKIPGAKLPDKTLRLKAMREVLREEAKLVGDFCKQLKGLNQEARVAWRSYLGDTFELEARRVGGPGIIWRLRQGLAQFRRSLGVQTPLESSKALRHVSETIINKDPAPLGLRLLV